MAERPLCRTMRRKTGSKNVVYVLGTPQHPGDDTMCLGLTMRVFLGPVGPVRSRTGSAWRLSTRKQLVLSPNQARRVSIVSVHFQDFLGDSFELPVVFCSCSAWSFRLFGSPSTIIHFRFRLFILPFFRPVSSKPN